MYTFITPPRTSYFVHGFRTWDQFSSFQRFETEMSCSLQLDGHTNPFRPFGVIIAVEEGGLIKGFDQDVASLLIDGEKVFGYHSKAESLPQYSEINLVELLENTSRYTHNELWVKAESVHVVGAYCMSDTYGVSGAKAFRKECHASGLNLREIPTSSNDSQTIKRASLVFSRVGEKNYLTTIVSNESSFINSNKLAQMMSEQTKRSSQ